MSNSHPNLIWHSLEPDQVLKELESDPRQGLTEEEAKNRLETYGTNELKKEEKTSPLTLFFNQFKNILILILLVAVVLSALRLCRNGEGMRVD